MDAKLSELELISPRGGFRFTLSDGDDRKVLNRKLPRDKVLGFSAAPHMRAPPSIVFLPMAIRGELSFPQGIPC
jgi:hypothetical protein